MKDRIRQIMEHYGLSQQNFATRLDISAATISSIFNGRTNPTNKQVQAIHRAFPEVDTNWLMFGEGEMMRPPADGDALEGNSEEGAVQLGNAAVENSLFGEVLPTASTAGATALAGNSQGMTSAVGRVSRRDAAVMAQQLGAMAEMTNIIDKKVRKIKEIRVFFDDGTFEVFSPSSK